jgi:hypothetical protein
MSGQDWRDLLVQINKQVLSDWRLNSLVTEAQKSTQWLGNVGATEAELLQLEQRLGKRLPPSYRSFLATSNGFGPISSFIYNLSTTAEVDWLRVKEQKLVEMWDGETPEDAISQELLIELADERYLLYDDSQIEGLLRAGHMRQCLMISDWGDAGFLALNPAIQHEGEWEAWHFANWYPGAVRYRSFAELMQASLNGYIELKQEGN